MGLGYILSSANSVLFVCCAKSELLIAKSSMIPIFFKNLMYDTIKIRFFCWSKKNPAYSRVFKKYLNKPI